MLAVDRRGVLLPSDGPAIKQVELPNGNYLRISNFSRFNAPAQAAGLKNKKIENIQKMRRQKSWPHDIALHHWPQSLL